jgi:hypothetical protein
VRQHLLVQLRLVWQHLLVKALLLTPLVPHCLLVVKVPPPLVPLKALVQLDLVQPDLVQPDLVPFPWNYYQK